METPSVNDNAKTMSTGKMFVNDGVSETDMEFNYKESHRAGPTIDCAIPDQSETVSRPLPLHEAKAAVGGKGVALASEHLYTFNVSPSTTKRLRISSFRAILR